MVIQIRGTSGSGKTTVMRQVMEQYNPWIPVYVERRKNPLYYHTIDKRIVVLGHYEPETQCAGCDTIGSASAVFKVLNQVINEFDVILCEGLLLGEDRKWALDICNQLYIVYLTTPFETCIERIKQRRQQSKRNNQKPLNVARTRVRAGTIARTRQILLDHGAVCRRCSSDQAVKVIMRWIDSVTCN